MKTGPRVSLLYGLGGSPPTGSRPPARHPALAALLLLVLSAGCRSASEGPAVSSALARRVGHRAAVLIAGAEIEYATGPRGEALARPAGPHFRGTATALTPDGYYLTAAHCVERQPVHLFIKGPAEFTLRRAAVVWS